ncbi:unnamed protein product [Symbiodinium sp. KB8]|nr:unnamed protein product [Symbiodinium sp. KB8]
MIQELAEVIILVAHVKLHKILRHHKSREELGSRKCCNSLSHLLCEGLPQEEDLAKNLEWAPWRDREERTHSGRRAHPRRAHFKRVESDIQVTGEYLTNYLKEMDGDDSQFKDKALNGAR